MRLYVNGSMTNDDHDLFNSGSAQVVETRLNDSGVTKREQWFEFAHPARPPGSKQDCGNVFH